MKSLSIMGVSAVLVCLAASIAVAGGAGLLNQLGRPGSWSTTCIEFGSDVDCWIADDFTPDFDCTVDSFSCQFTSDRGGSSPSADLELRIYTDRLSDKPVWEISVPAEDLDVSATGDLLCSRRVYQVDVEFDSADLFSARAGTTYWIAWRMLDERSCRNLTVNAGYSGDSWAWRYADDSWCEIGTDADAAFYLGGTQPTDVYASSFGYIKAMYQ